MTPKSAETAGAGSRVDRRVLKTKRHLSQALIELIIEKGYERVTIQDILDRADVGRSTFYAHYESKDLLLVAGPRNLGLSLFGEGVTSTGAPGSHPMGFRAFFEHVSSSRPLAKAMLGRGGGAPMIEAFREQAADAIRRHHQGGSRSSSRDRQTCRYLADAAAAAVMSLLSSWVDDDFDVSVSDISNRCQQVVEGIFGPDGGPRAQATS